MRGDRFKMKKQLSTLLAIMLLTTACPLPAGAQFDTATLNSVVTVPGGDQHVNIEVTGENVRSVLRNLSLEGGFNLLMDESVTGSITLQLQNVSINDALQAIAAMNNIIIVQQPGNIYLAISRQAAQDKGIARQLSKVIKIYYANAQRVASVLNQSIFNDPNAAAGGGGGGGAGGGAAGGAQDLGRVRHDARSNSIVVVGTQREIELAETAVAKLDIPRQSKTFYLSHANAVDVATMLASSIFNDGTAVVNIGGAAAAAGGGAAGDSLPTNLRVETQNIQEGEGITEFGSGSGMLSQVQLRAYVKETGTMQVSPEGPLVVPDSRSNSVTIMGTAEQIALAESIIPRLDAQLPQVAIEASLIEITQEGVKELGTVWGGTLNKLNFGFNNNGTLGLRTADPTDNTNSARSGIGFATPNVVGRPITDVGVSILNLVQKQKAKILANPTVVATHDTESIISIVDEIVRRVTVTIDPNGFAQQEVEIGEAGIILNILPKIGEDGTINMRLRPAVSTISGPPIRDAAGNLITLVSRRDLFAQNVRIQDGQTLVIGGLVREDENTRIDKIPGLGDLPIVGAMFRASSRGTTDSPNRKTELVLMITPHILNKTKLTPVTTVQTGMLTGGEQ